MPVSQFDSQVDLSLRGHTFKLRVSVEIQDAPDFENPLPDSLGNGSTVINVERHMNALAYDHMGTLASCVTLALDKMDRELRDFGKQVSKS